jgi:hypothetical protein
MLRCEHHVIYFRKVGLRDRADPTRNAKRMRPPRHPERDIPREPVAFDPSCTTAMNTVDDEEVHDENG